MRICVPVENKEGLDSKVHGHFGSAPFFIIYDTDKETSEAVDNTNAHHAHGMCHPIGTLGASSIDAVVCRGMGMRAVQKLNQSGIKAYRAEGETVSLIVKMFKDGKLDEITVQNACAQHQCH